MEEDEFEDSITGEDVASVEALWRNQVRGSAMSWARVTENIREEGQWTCGWVR